MFKRVDTKELLARSLLELAKSNPLQKITISEITEKCSITREAFYYHFADKYELMFWIYKKHTSEIIDKGIFIEPIIDVWSKALRVMQDYRYFYKDAYEDPIFLRMILNAFIENLSSCVSHHAGEKELENPDIKFAIRFYANGLLNVTIEWLNQIIKGDVDVISRRMCAIMPRILLKYYIFDDDHNTYD